MANATSANLKLTVQTTGENSGTWGQITNTNLLILEQAIGGYGKDDVIKLTGTLEGNLNVTMPDSVEKTYIVQDTCNHANYTLTFKTTSGTGVALCEGHTYRLWSDGTNVYKAQEEKVWRAITASDLTVNTQGAAFTLVYSGDATTGWTYTEK